MEAPTGEKFWYVSLYEAMIDDEKRMIMRRSSKGFNAYELLGVLENIKSELLEAIHDNQEKFDTFERSIIHEGDDKQIS